MTSLIAIDSLLFLWKKINSNIDVNLCDDKYVNVRIWSEITAEAMIQCRAVN